MTDEKTAQTESENVNKMVIFMDKLITSIDKTYGRVENDLTNALTEIRTLRWKLQRFNDYRLGQEIKHVHKTTKELIKDAEGAAISLSRAAKEMKNLREEVAVKDKPQNLAEISPEEFNRRMDAISEPPSDATSMFPVPADEEEDDKNDEN